MKAPLSLIFLLCAIISSHAQSDYRKGFVVRQETDTTYGLLKYREGVSAHRACSFKQSETADVVEYKPGEITAYGFSGDKHFETKVVSLTSGMPAPVFAEVIVEGFVSLYRIENIFAIEKQDEGLHLLKNETTITESNGKKVVKQSNQHVATLNMLLFDCVELRERISQIRISEKNFARLVSDYNTCKGEHSVTYKAKKPWLKVTGSVFGGVSTSKITFRENNPDFDHLVGTFDKSTSPTGGISLDFSSPRTNERLSLHIDIFYLKSRYTKYSEAMVFVVKETNYVNIELKELKTPVGLRYTLPGRRFSPFFNAGLAPTFHVGRSSLWIRELDGNDQILTYEDEALSIQKYQFGFWGGFGTNIRLTHKLDGFIEFRYEQTDGIGAIGHPTILSQVKNIQIFVGLRKK